MEPVHLDFAVRRRPPGAYGWLVFVLGAVSALTVLASEHLHWRPIIAADVERLRTLQKALDSTRPPAPGIDDVRMVAEWTRAITVAEDLNLPWERLFAAFEAHGDRPVALLALDPDAGKRSLVLTAEARTFDEMLSYYRMLQQQDIFSGIALHTHQVNVQDREKPIRFRVTAKWAARS